MNDTKFFFLHLSIISILIVMYDYISMIPSFAKRFLFIQWTRNWMGQKSNQPLGNLELYNSFFFMMLWFSHLLFITIPSPLLWPNTLSNRYTWCQLQHIKFMCSAKVYVAQIIRSLEIVVVVLGKRLGSGCLKFLFVLVFQVFIELELWRLQGRCLDKS